MMKYQKIKFITNDPQAEAEYICYLAKSIARGFYQECGFLVLPHPLPGNRNAVHFPKLPYSNNFWEKIVKNKNGNYGKSFPKACIQEVKSHLEKQSPSPNGKKDQKTISSWQEVEKEFFDLMQKFLCFDKLLPNITKINFLLTDFGTSGSFNSLEDKDQIRIIATHRRDFPIAEITRTMLLTLYRIKNPDTSQIAWHQRRKVADFLLIETAFSQLFPDYSIKKGLLDEKHADKHVDKSKKYLVELGFPAEPVLSTDTNQDLMLAGKVVTNSFTPQERKILSMLLVKRNQTVSHDELAEVLWEDQAADKFSLYAITKVIENIRHKLHWLGVHQNLIATVRGQGYLLKD